MADPVIGRKQDIEDQVAVAGSFDDTEIMDIVVLVYRCDDLFYDLLQRSGLLILRIDRIHVDCRQDLVSVQYLKFDVVDQIMCLHDRF